MNPLHLHAGDRAPDVGPLIGAESSGQRLFEMLRDRRHALLLAVDDQPLDKKTPLRR